MTPQLTTGDYAIIWANRALISAAAIFLYDFALTFTTEIELYRHSGRDRKLLWSFLALRYFPALYQFLMVSAIIYNKPTFSVSSSLLLDFVSVLTATRRSRVIRLDFHGGALISYLSYIVTILPCLRAAFDAATTLALLTKLWRHIASMGALASNTVSFVLTEEIKDIILIFAIMTMEAVFVQIPSARTHARNFIVPFVDSLTAILATRFMLELEERSRNHGKSRRSSTARLPLPSNTLVASDVPDRVPVFDDSASSLKTFETRSIGWNRIGSCLGARGF
ncbi:hypothetical protein B0H19DRAFT_1253695 [Mycena capillaripes]|nr:hypothetical protein B0H19DRAFT_1253695 [Mycena capillaripes]